MTKALKFEKHTITTRDNDGDEHESEVVSAVVDGDTAGTEVFLRDGTGRPLRSGEVVVPAGGGKYDVFTADQWDAMWNDSERVADHGGALRSQDVADDNEYKDVADDNEPDDMDDYRAWRAAKDADSNDERPQDTVPDAPKDDVTPSAPAKKAASSNGKRS